MLEAQLPKPPTVEKFYEGLEIYVNRQGEKNPEADLFSEDEEPEPTKQGTFNGRMVAIRAAFDFRTIALREGMNFKDWSLSDWFCAFAKFTLDTDAMCDTLVEKNKILVKRGKLCRDDITPRFWSPRSLRTYGNNLAAAFRETCQGEDFLPGCRKQFPRYNRYIGEGITRCVCGGSGRVSF